jgi:hypothetical protein
VAFAESYRLGRFQNQATKFAAVESQMGLADQRALDEHLDAIEAVLARYPAPLQLLCLSNGREAPYEKFRITDASTGAALGGETTLDTCRQLLSVQNQNLMCVSNGQNGVYEEFAVYDLGRKYTIGGFTAIKTCQALVSTARLTLVCLSDGRTSTYEKFHLYNRSLERTLGGAVSMDQCISTLGG